MGEYVEEDVEEDVVDVEEDVVDVEEVVGVSLSEGPGFVELGEGADVGEGPGGGEELFSPEHGGRQLSACIWTFKQSTPLGSVYKLTSSPSPV